MKSSPSDRASHGLSPPIIHLLVKAQVPISIFLAGPVGEISKSKISIGKPSVVQAFGIYWSQKNVSVSLRTSTLTFYPSSHQLCRRHEQKDGTHIHNPGNMPLHRRTTQQQIHLIVTVPKPAQILNDPQGRLPIRHRRIHEVLLPVLIDAKSLEGEVAAGAELGLHGALVEDGGFHAEVGDAVFHDGEFDGYNAGHFDGAAEGYFAVALWERELAEMFWWGKGRSGGMLTGEVKISDAEFSAVNVDR